MGASYAAVHVQGVRPRTVVADVTRALVDAGYRRLRGSARAARERRIVVVEAGGWTTLADEDHLTDPAQGEAWARALTKRHGARAVVVLVVTSDFATVSAWSKGRRRGAFENPADAQLDRRRGHAIIDTRFLASWAEGAAKEELAAGLVADGTLAQAVATQACDLLGISGAGSGAPYAWDEAPASSTRLRFAAPRGDEADDDDGAGDEPDPDAHAIVLEGGGPVQVCVGMPIDDELLLHATAHAGRPQRGVVVELAGPGLALLHVRGILGWNPSARASVVDAKAVARGGALRVALLSLALRPGRRPTLTGTTAGHLRAWQRALARQSARECWFRLRADAVRAGCADVWVRLLDAAGAPLDASTTTITVNVTAAPRMPALPRPKPRDARLRHAALAAAQALDGDDFVQGWIAIDAAWVDVRAWALDAASRLAVRAAHGGRLEVHVTSAGTHPPVRRRFGGGDHLAKGFAVALRALDDEAIVVLEHPLGDDDAFPAFVRLSHQPAGTTILGKDERHVYADDATLSRNVPVAIDFALPKGAAAARVVDAVLRAAADLPGLVGAFAAPVRTPTWRGGFAFDELSGAGDLEDDVALVRRSVRAPGWMVFVPRAAASRVDVSPGLRRTEHPAGSLLRSRAPSPFAMTDDDRAAIERAVARAVPTRELVLAASRPAMSARRRR